MNFKLVVKWRLTLLTLLTRSPAILPTAVSDSLGLEFEGRRGQDIR
jgi:hypothetical protein